MAGGEHEEVNGYDVAGQEIITPAEPPQQEPPEQDDQQDGH
ncbi:hypothetical protein RM780_19195 [Streptomyces sp. DSM 44917]|uniref:Uncharacterized protein n=1 Tax=Streptomyces boetiae TaxID=3075541 RepID=A0ABU2LBX4_9ACTN|nr:hypothetical protein [Streptomyces sp. DSM 44917]MDT0309070.1 hypothetical protein [Streptomyces sp. DSM 44917]